MTTTVIPDRLLMSETDWQERLRELTSLTDGWFDGEGLAMKPDMCEAAWKLCQKVNDEGFLRPGIFPTPEGGLQLEWPIAYGNEYREIIVFALEPDLTYEMHRTKVRERSYDEFSTPFLCAAIAKLNEWFKEFEASKDTDIDTSEAG